MAVSGMWMSPERTTLMDVPGKRFTLRFSLAITGGEIRLPNVSMRVRTETYLEWFLRYVARVVNWPISHSRLHVYDKTVQHDSRGITRTMLLALAKIHGQAEHEPIHVMVERLPPPTRLGSGICICDFGGCCCLCHVPSNIVCEGCGNNGCCRSGNCDHECCAARVGAADVELFCGIQGCRPCGASY